MNIQILSPKKRRNEVEYVLKILFSVMGMQISFDNKSDILINYGFQNNDEINAKLQINIPQNDEEFIDTEWKIQGESEHLITINFKHDIIRQSFDWLNRTEEINNPKFIKAFIGERKIIRKPYVNIYANQLWNAIKKFATKLDIELPKRKNWLGEKDFAVVLTHDVDSIKKWSLRWQVGRLLYALEGLLHLDFATIKTEMNEFFPSILLKRDPFWNFDIIENLEIKRNIRSTFFFLTESKDFERKRYKLDKKLKGVISKLRKLDFEIGLHGSRYSFADMPKMKSELEKLEESVPIVKGIRQHYLLFDIMKTWYIQEKCGFVYDSTLGYNDAIGFRCGICHPYKPFGKNIYELPLNIMDITLFNIKNYSPSKAFKRAISILEEVKRYNGVGVILWHQRNFGNSEYVELYEKLLDWIQSNNGEIMTAIQAIKQFFD